MPMIPIPAMCLFALGMSISPGPVNIVTMTSAVNSGARKTMLYVSGATIGFTLLLLFVGLFYVQLAHLLPVLVNYLRYVGAFYIFYMGFKIITSKPTPLRHDDYKSPSFLSGFLTQCLNPKAWVAVISGISAFTSSASYIPLFVFASLYFMICYASIASWAVLGDKMAVLLNNDRQYRLFNWAMGGLLMATAVYLLFL